MESTPAPAILEAIRKGRIEPVYLLHGPETYWHDAIVQALRDALLPPGDVMNFTQLDGRVAGAAEVVEQARIVPFLAERRLLVVRDAAWLAPRGGGSGGGRGGARAGSQGGEGSGRRGGGAVAGARPGSGTGQRGPAHPDTGPGPDAEPASPGGDAVGDGEEAAGGSEAALLAYLDDPAPTAVLVISHPGDVDGRRAVVRRLRQRGWAVACEPLRDDALARWLQQQAAAWGKELEPEALAWLLESGEPDLQRLASEIAKVATYVGDRRRIAAADLRAVGVALATAGVFELVDAVAAGRRRQAMDLLGRLLDANEPPLRLLALIARQYRILAYACSLRAEGGDAARLQQLLGLHPFVARKAWQQARDVPLDRAMAALEAVLETDVGIKQGRWPARIGLERLVWYLSGSSGGPGPAPFGSRPAAGSLRGPAARRAVP
ncbi:DNA polymerase III, delta subunit [Thermaerobacter marianensis DSM 12885]|uniref:DNA-directed DNA polymerase n=1 Tax=Thermaerobacter marianensis (strain ATCC 700841 / DSM 12885 / JCM 10246 / 7p75a) TaxID=644966 RepID=E6SKB6_THEM7|nr:DNA polymerase III subunit delta [Thermaerobacter marianensis]ADU52274.1 DNA polymerase III, delta subunit [Thermaerobacter marianensis DSM 12885]